MFSPNRTNLFSEYYDILGSGMPVPGGYPSSTGYPPSTAGGYPSYPAYPQASGYPGGTNSQAGGYPAYPSYNPTATTATTQGNAGGCRPNFSKHLNVIC